MKHTPSFVHLTDVELSSELERQVLSERAVTASVVACLAEFDRRRLYLGKGYGSLFDYCVKVLRLTEHESLNRIEAARAVRKFPGLLQHISSGSLSLTAVRLLAPHLTAANHQDVIKRAEGKAKDAIKLLIATLNPQPPVPSVVRKLPDVKPVALTPSTEVAMSLAELVARPEPPPSRRPIVAPLSESHYKLQVTISASARERLKQIQDLMRHRVPSGDPAAIVEHALEVLHAELLKKKAAEVAKPRLGHAGTEAKGRYIPASVRRAVFRRDQGKCVFVTEDGATCGATGGIEFHHVQPYAVGGEASVGNIELRCRAHNGFEWTRHVDEETVAMVDRGA